MSAESLEKLNQFEMWLSSARNSLTLARDLCDQIERSETHAPALKEFARQNLDTLKLCEGHITVLNLQLAAFKSAEPQNWLSHGLGGMPSDRPSSL